jgi:hypothetical protein
MINLLVGHAAVQLMANIVKKSKIKQCHSVLDYVFLQFFVLFLVVEADRK